ncbi:aminotransferase class V-fold PLP-dependent enzyme [Thalassotalea sp. HSM 43]|uniref:aminotransferase class V-fold PLP-dependent enzyme n=1 Tax=Thalassotalea sp. HSM 43 TaxID=2552945 RepID=UPI001080DF53|nr:aminotransferase class V-fold PLP-dependent enzyme [Thalassotalea sp. HSM 43]QBY02905.1 aminotransferase class V-fold PLP-dependent enzyme [Thalassotalea sp. HSM 43]
MLRRQFISRMAAIFGGSVLSTQALSKAALSSTSASTSNALAAAATSISPGDWQALRKLFPLTHDYVQLSTFLLASHPKPVADAIAEHRKGLDENPSDYWHDRFLTVDQDIAKSAANYMGGKAENIALTDSTTMGLGTMYNALALDSGDEILQTTHDHYSTDMSLAFAAKRAGASIKRIDLYDDPAKTSTKDVLQRLRDGIGSETKVIAVTWVHSCTGVKLPIRAMANTIAQANKQRRSDKQILFCVDGVHGFGIEDENIDELGCDFFVAGTHKWIFGPRGTGVIWGNDKAWQMTAPVIPSFSESYDVWLGLTEQDKVWKGQHMTPGGFHSFEHRWALPKAFELHMQLGKANVQKRIHQLNTQTKQGLAKMKHVKLYTPMSSSLSSGLVVFDVDGLPAEQVVKKLHDKGIIMSATPYRNSYSRFAPSLINNENEIEAALAEIARLA